MGILLYPARSLPHLFRA